MMPLLQAESLAITSVTFVLSAVLALFLFSSYRRARRPSLAFWTAGMAVFTFGVLLEILFALDIVPLVLVDVYLFSVALIVELLALGSMELLSSRAKRRAYQAFCVATTAFLALMLALYGSVNIVQDYVAFGNPALPVILGSSFITFPASVILVWMALLSYSKTGSRKMLSIVAGVIVVVIAGTLYIAAFPAFLYVSEFIGILLLWAGFYSRPQRRP